MNGCAMKPRVAEYFLWIKYIYIYIYMCVYVKYIYLFIIYIYIYIYIFISLEAFFPLSFVQKRNLKIYWSCIFWNKYIVWKKEDLRVFVIEDA